MTRLTDLNLGGTAVSGVRYGYFPKKVCFPAQENNVFQEINR
jgi:hypothetical protein